MTVEKADSTVEEVTKPTPYVPGPNAIDVSPSKDSGVLKEVLREGEGSETPQPGSKVFVHYVGTLTDGTKFDSSRDRGTPFEFNIGKGNVIKAWDIGVATMKKGELAVFSCKSEYAYGENGSPPKIPPNATLIFEIEVLDWQGEDLSQKKDGGILRYQIEAGEGYATPNDGAAVEVHLTGKYQDNVFEDRDVIFPLGEGSEYGVCEGLERALEKFKKGEKSRILLKSKYAFKKDGKPEFNIPSNADIEYVVHLINFEKAKESWSLDTDGKLEQAKFFKEKGTNYFKAGKYTLAAKMYKNIITFMEFESGFEGEKDVQRKSLLLAGHLNLAMCYLKLDEHIEARDNCDKALDLEPTNLKGLFRRGQAYLAMGEPERAKVDFEMVLKLEPSNKAAASHVVMCNNKLREQKGREKMIYANMFEKFAKQDKAERSNLVNGWWDGDKVVTEKDDDLVPKIEKKKKVLNIKRPGTGDSNNKSSENDRNNTNTPQTSESKKEEEQLRNQPDVMKTLGEWGKDEREHEMTDFERENPNILMLNSTGEEFKNM
ncbi:hypothetical protein R5R35_010986 [Gryllus longicercus]|uniref:peptidylprolyl isomerase n=1 Tax=Gryllus longicercus TaxID=2509291 RepID=A0AAN9VM28_9ORTH